MPGPLTQLAGVVGHPIAHSLSPAIHNAALTHEGRDAVYLAFDVVPDDFDAFVAGMRAAGVRGLNVTIPHKGAAFDAADWRSEVAEATRAVNTLVFEDGRIAGHNTDVPGILLALGDLGVEIDGCRALVIGAGGSGRAAAYALAQRCDAVLVANRTASKASELAAGLEGVEALPWEDIAGGRVDVVVHATPVGLADDEMVVSPDDLARLAGSGCRAVLDLVYAPGETALVRAARGAGVTAADGLGVLVHQGAEAYRLIWGADPPIDVMRQAARLI